MPNTKLPIFRFHQFSSLTSDSNPLSLGLAPCRSSLSPPISPDQPPSPPPNHSPVRLHHTKISEMKTHLSETADAISAGQWSLLGCTNELRDPKHANHRKQEVRQYHRRSSLPWSLICFLPKPLAVLVLASHLDWSLSDLGTRFPLIVYMPCCT